MQYYSSINSDLTVSPNTPVYYGWHETPFGRCLIGVYQDHVCYLSFLDTLDEFKKLWPNGVLASELTKPLLTNFFSQPTHMPPLLLRGTPLQIQVWLALLRIPFGQVVSYSDIAAQLGTKGIRWVGRAIGANKIALMVPCHRVIAKSGHLHGYRWGLSLKKIILDWETSFEAHDRTHRPLKSRAS